MAIPDLIYNSNLFIFEVLTSFKYFQYLSEIECLTNMKWLWEG